METVARRIVESVEGLGYECVHVGLKTEHSGTRLQVLIDSLGGIDVEDCERVSKAVNRILDEEDFQPASGSYALEVSSPGVERPLFTLSQYGRFIGREARLRLLEPVEGRKNLTGKIITVNEAEPGEVSGGTVTLYVEDEEREIAVPFEAIKTGNLVFRFEDGTPKKKGKNKKHRGEVSGGLAPLILELKEER